MRAKMKIVICGLSITSTWGNGHATVYRALVKALATRRHDVTFLERNVPWYARHRDLPRPPFGRTRLYRSVDELRRKFEADVRGADLVIVGSYVPDGVEVGRWVTETTEGLTAFYDIDTPITLAKLVAGDHEYLDPDLVKRYGLYLSFTGGPTLRKIERDWGSPAARALYCCVDPELYYPDDSEPAWDLGYMGTYSEDRQPALERLLLGPAKRRPRGRYVVAGPMYPEEVHWPASVERIEHLRASEHRAFYNRQRFTLNITRQRMREAGWSPSVRLFEAAACGTPIISDTWEGLSEVLEPGREVLLAASADDTLRHLRDLSESQRRQIADRARHRVLRQHTAEVRASELERYVAELAPTRRKRRLVKAR